MQTNTLQLESTAWPKFHRNLKNTGQSLYTSDANGVIKWYINFPSNIRGTPTIDIDGTIYVGMDSLYAINPDGTVKWSYPDAGSEYSSPIISQDGIIYNFGTYSNLYALNRDGTLVWSFSTGMSGLSGPAMGLDGNIYIGDSGNEIPWPGIFIAIAPSGNEVWRYTTNDHGTPETPIGGSAENFSPAISPIDGTIYVKIREDPYTYLVAFTQNGVEKWRVTIASIFWSSIAVCPAIGPDGTIYIPGIDNTNVYIYAITDNGNSATIKWQYTLCTGDLVRIEDVPTIATDGTIYIAARYRIGGIYYYNKYAITDNGNSATLKWSFPSNKYIRSPAMIGLDGTIYFGSNGDGSLARFYALNPDGTLKWFKDLVTQNSIVCSPSMAPDGTIYAGTDGTGSDPSGQSLVAFQSLVPCPIAPKYSGDTVTLYSTPNNGIEPYYVEFRKNGILIPSSRLQDQPNPIIDAPENILITRIYTLDDLDISSASSGIINFSVFISDSCPTGAHTCTETCALNIACAAPVCNFTVT